MSEARKPGYFLLVSGSMLIIVLYHSKCPPDMERTSTLGSPETRAASASSPAPRIVRAFFKLDRLHAIRAAPVCLNQRASDSTKPFLLRTCAPCPTAPC